jgi:glycosyltransferase involved in cell wall biosynthesis
MRIETDNQEMNPEISVIIPVYNAVPVLELVLTGYLRQNHRSFEIFIADDGSGPAMKSFLEDFSRHAFFPIRHVFQPDEGFRKTSILNQAVRTTSAPYLIFADADCIPHSRFVEAHWIRRESRAVLCGRRVNLDARLSKGLTPKDVFEGVLERVTPIRVLDALLRRGGHWDEGVLIRNRALHYWINYKEPTLLGCNFSIERSLLEEINGFNEDFHGYSGEDTELEYRLRLAGAAFRWVRHLAIQYHLYHAARTNNPENLRALAQSYAEGKAACRNGLRKHC